MSTIRWTLRLFLFSLHLQPPWQYLVSPFQDRVGQPSHSLCDTGWPASCGKTPPLRQAVAPLLKLDEASDRIYAQEIRQNRKWEKLIAKQRKQQSLPEEMELPQRKCHVVVNSTIEALVSALRMTIPGAYSIYQ